MIKLNVKPTELTDEVSRRGSFFKYLPEEEEHSNAKNEVKVRQIQKASSQNDIDGTPATLPSIGRKQTISQVSQSGDSRTPEQSATLPSPKMKI